MMTPKLLPTARSLPSEGRLRTLAFLVLGWVMTMVAEPPPSKAIASIDPYGMVGQSMSKYLKVKMAHFGDSKTQPD